MTQEDKELLLKDFCARLPYKVKGIITYDKSNTTFTVEGIDNNVLHLSDAEECYVEDFKPYLRSVYTMTEEEMDKLFDILHIDKDGNDEDWIKINDVTGIKFFLPAGRWIEEIDEAMSYLRSIHIDINGLIPKGLALEALEGMYNTKE